MPLCVEFPGDPDGLGSFWGVGNENFLRLVKLLLVGLALWRRRGTAGFEMGGVAINTFLARGPAPATHPPAFLL